ncbi:MAG: phenylalanine--tRNA ligase subunit beta [Firmicutes bacterium]|nr:phenylalanine--tRNA ligase subunit beta [Bacillota bacterium]
MRISYDWLKDYVDVDVPVVELADLLTLSGSEVESVGPLGPDLHGKIVVAKITHLEDHPTGKLQVALADIGEGSRRIVTGAPNVAVGQKVPLALAGATLPSGQVIETADFQGIVSQGMLCSLSELELGDDNSGIMILPDDTPVGLPLAEALQLDDTIIELELYPNRPDCLSVIGIAREVAAITGKDLRTPEITVVEKGEPIDALTSITVEDPELCPLYTARIVKNVHVGPSPLWLQQRVTAGGMRPINNVVDVTNYVLLEMGQPLHAFDYDTLEEGRIVVRRARPQEMITTLDHEDRVLDPDTLVIADAEKPACIAGIMGGAISEVTDKTSSILLEAAIFHGANIRRTSRRLGLRSEASARFEKGLDPQGVTKALDRAAQLLAEIAGGEVCQGVAIADAVERPEIVVNLRPKMCNRLLGVEIPVANMIDILERLGFEVTKQDGQLEVKVPSHRLDIELEADLIEEVARLYGYDRIPATLPKGTGRGGEDERLNVIGDIRNLLVGVGLTETMTYSFDSPTSYDKLRLPADHRLRRAVTIRNPLTEDMGILRTTLISQMLEVARHNVRHQQGDLQIFQLGAVYIPKELPIKEQPDELQTLGILLMGNYPREWGFPPRVADFFDLKGLVEALFDSLGVECQWKAANHPSFHPGRCATVQIGDNILGILGEIHPEVGSKWELPARAYVAEINLEHVLPFVGREIQVEKLPRFPAVARDLALVAPDDIPAERILKTIQAHGGELVKGITLFDVYQGRQIPAGHRSLAYSIRYQAPDRTLTDKEIQAAEDAIMDGLKEELGIGRR